MKCNWNVLITTFDANFISFQTDGKTNEELEEYIRDRVRQSTDIVFPDCPIIVYNRTLKERYIFNASGAFDAFAEPLLTAFNRCLLNP
jgi:hypothetical protein